jgi:hypothetical protein
MSYIPRYIIKRMVRKDGVKLVDGNIEITVTNAIAPLVVDEVPEDVINYLEFQVDGKVVVGGEVPESSKDFQMKFGEKIFTIDTLKDALGETLPVGGQLTITYPNSIGLAKGETHEFICIIKYDSPIQLKFEREIQ